MSFYQHGGPGESVNVYTLGNIFSTEQAYYQMHIFNTSDLRNFSITWANTYNPNNAPMIWYLKDNELINLNVTTLENTYSIEEAEFVTLFYVSASVVGKFNITISQQYI